MKKPKRQSEAVNGRRIENTLVAKITRTNGQTKIYDNTIENYRLSNTSPRMNTGSALRCSGSN